MSGLPPRPPADTSRATGGSLIPLMLAIGVGMAAVVGLMFLTLGVFAYVVIAGALLFTVAAIQYVLWGHWLEKRVRREVEEEERIEREQAARNTAAISKIPGEERPGEVPRSAG